MRNEFLGNQQLILGSGYLETLAARWAGESTELQRAPGEKIVTAPFSCGSFFKKPMAIRRHTYG